MEKYEELLVALRKVIRAIDLHSKKLNKTLGLTAPQLLILQEVGNQKGIAISKVAKNINLSPATITNITDRLESREMLVRKRSQQDKRRVELYLTEQGEAALASAPKPLQDHFIEKFCSLEEWEQSLLLSSMERIASMMDAQDLDAAPVLEVGAIASSTKKET